MIAQLVASGAVMGLIYALIAFGFQLTYATSKTANFGQGAIVMGGGLIAAWLAPKIGFFWALPAILIIGALAGILVERICIAPALGQSSNTAWVVSTIAFGIISMGVLEIIFGKDELAVPTPFSEDPINLRWFAILPHEIFVLVLCFVVMGVLELFSKSRMGKAFEAVATDKDAASLQGIPAFLIVGLSYAISASLGGLAGWAVSPLTGAGPTLEMLGVKGFAAAVVGSLQSSRGALIAGLLIGISESLAAFWLPSGFRAMPALVACALVIAFKPTGLFGAATIKKV